MIRTGVEIAAKIDEELFFQKKTKAGLGVALGAKETDDNQTKFQKFSLLKRQLDKGNINQEKLQKVAEYLDTTVEELMIKEDNNTVIAQGSSGNRAVFEDSQNNTVEFTRTTARREDLNMEEKIDLIFDKVFGKGQ